MTNSTKSPYFVNNYPDGAHIGLNMDWLYAGDSMIHSDYAVMYKAAENRRNITIGVEAGHGVLDDDYVFTYCHPDHTAKITDDLTQQIFKVPSNSYGMAFPDGTPEYVATLALAQHFKNMLLAEGYDVLMVRDRRLVQLDVIARTVICNHAADCHISLHFDSDPCDYEKGCFYLAVMDEMKAKEPVASVWEQSDALGDSLLCALRKNGFKIFLPHMKNDLMQTAYSSVPSVIIELGNQFSDHSDVALQRIAESLIAGVNLYYNL